MADEIKVLPRDLPAAGICMTGAAEWFKRHDLDFRDFIHNGIAVSVVMQTGCPLGERACQAARKRVADEGA